MIIQKLRVETKDGYREFSLADREAAEQFAKEIDSKVEDITEVLPDPLIFPDYQTMLNEFDGLGFYPTLIELNPILAEATFRSTLQMINFHAGEPFDPNGLGFRTFYFQVGNVKALLEASGKADLYASMAEVAKKHSVIVP